MLEAKRMFIDAACISCEEVDCLVLYSYHSGSPQKYNEPEEYDDLEVVAVYDRETAVEIYDCLLDDERDSILDKLWSYKK